MCSGDRSPAGVLGQQAADPQHVPVEDQLRSFPGRHVTETLEEFKEVMDTEEMVSFCALYLPLQPTNDTHMLIYVHVCTRTYKQGHV